MLKMEERKNKKLEKGKGEREKQKEQRGSPAFKVGRGYKEGDVLTE